MSLVSLTRFTTGWVEAGTAAGVATGVPGEKQEESSMSEPAASHRMSMPFCSVILFPYYNTYEFSCSLASLAKEDQLL